MKKAKLLIQMTYLYLLNEFVANLLKIYDISWDLRVTSVTKNSAGPPCYKTKLSTETCVKHGRKAVKGHVSSCSG